MTTDWDWSEAGRNATIATGAYEALKARRWDTCYNVQRDGQSGIIAGRYGKGTRDHHVGVEFDDGEVVGFPPEFVKIAEAA